MTNGAVLRIHQVIVAEGICRAPSRRADRAAVVPVVPRVLPVDVLLLLHAGHAHIPVSLGAHSSPVGCFFSFHPRPARHASASLRRAPCATCAPSARSTRCRSRPPRGVTVFAERAGQTGASKPQKRRHHRGCTCSPAHAPSRRLQRVSLLCTRVLAGNRCAGAPGGDRFSEGINELIFTSTGAYALSKLISRGGFVRSILLLVTAATLTTPLTAGVLLKDYAPAKSRRRSSVMLVA